MRNRTTDARGAPKYPGKSRNVPVTGMWCAAGTTSFRDTHASDASRITNLFTDKAKPRRVVGRTPQPATTARLGSGSAACQ